MMEAWRDNDKIDFSFFDAHDLYLSRDTSLPETIRRNLRERLKNAKQIVLIGTTHAKKKGGDGKSFLAHEVAFAIEFALPVVIANSDGDRSVDSDFIPKPFLDIDYYTISVSFQPAIIKYALHNYVPAFDANRAKPAGTRNTGPHYYKEHAYTQLGL
jgi:hypothetical protein